MPKVSSKKFFAEQSAHSRVKADIIFNYVLAWAPIILNRKFNARGEAAYFDLFSGPGSYQDGARSTPLLIAEQVINRSQLRASVRLFFNDSDPAMTNSLKQAINLLPEAQTLRFAPHFSSEPASLELVHRLALSPETPQFYFLDQFGWTSVHPNLIRRVFLNKKCDCAFFFRTSRVIAAVTNPNAEQAMTSIFGAAGLRSLRTEFKLLPRDKEAVLLHQLRTTMADVGATYFLPFPFRVSGTHSSRHHLIYLTKHPKGLQIMKEIMARRSTEQHSGVPTMGYTEGPVQHGLFAPDPIPELCGELLRTFAGRTVLVGRIFEEHQITNERFILPNYQEALRRLEADSRVRAKPSAAQRQMRKGVVTMSKLVQIKFPDGGAR